MRDAARIRPFGMRRGWWLGRRILVAALLLFAVASCSPKPEISVAPPEDEALTRALAACCASSDRYPIGLVKVVEGAAGSLVPFSRGVVLRDPYLQGKARAYDRLLSQARPLDLLLIANKAHLSGAAGTGHFGHSMLYIGTEADLRALGVWNHPAVVPFQARVRAGGLAIEAIDKAVRLAGPEQVMDSDATALFRPQGLSRAQKQRAVIYLFKQIGTPFDIHFDLDTDEALFCTELIDKALPEMGLPVNIAYGRRVIWPDEVATRSLLGKTGFRFLTYIRGTRMGWREAGWRQMAVDILAAWPEVPAPFLAVSAR